MNLIEDRLTQIRTQLRKLNSANEQIDYDVSYSEVTMYVREVKIYTEEKEKETFLQRIGRSISESAEGFLENMQDILVALIFLFPYIVVIALIVFLFRKPLKAWRIRRKEKKRLKKEAKAARAAAAGGFGHRAFFTGKPYPYKAEPENKAVEGRESENKELEESGPESKDPVNKELEESEPESKDPANKELK